MDKIYLGNKLESFEDSEPFLPISKVILKVDSQNGYTAGDDSGKTIEKTMPWATQEMADSILESLKGQVYKPFSGSGAFLDPAAELGDALTVAGNYGILAGMSRKLDRMGIADISAPGADELDDEFPYTPKSKREVERVLGKAYSRITKTANQILLNVEDELNGLSASINLKLDGITQQVTGLGGNVSTLQQTANSLTSRISTAEGNVSTLQQTIDGLTISDSSGTTKINGSAIYTDNLYVKAANISGTLTAGYLKGNYIYIYDGYGNYAGRITANAASTADYKLDISAGAVAITADQSGGAVHISNADGSFLQLYGTRVYCNAWFRPNVDNKFDIGSSNYRWNNIYAVNDVIQTSDKRRKKDISYGLEKYDRLFDGLKPSSYRMEGGKRTHTGLVAQDIEELLEQCGIDTMDFAAFIKTEREDKTGYDYGLRYGEFVPLLIDQLQKIKKRVKALEDKKHGKKSVERSI